MSHDPELSAKQPLSMIYELSRILWRREMLQTPEGVEWLATQVCAKRSDKDLGPNKQGEFEQWKLTRRS